MKKIGVLILAGAVLRIAGVGAASLWSDEAYSLLFARMPNILAGVQIEVGNFNNPLWHLLAWVSVHLVGAGEFGLRLPSLMAGLACLGLTWSIARQVTGNQAAQLSAVALAALLPYLIWMSQDGRCYAVMSLLYLAGYWFGSRARWMGFAACLGLLLYVHPTGLFYAAALVAATSLHAWPGWKPVVLASLTGGIAYLPWLPALFRAPKFWNDPLNAEDALGALFQAFFADTLDQYLLVALLVLLGSLVAALVVFARHHRKDRKAWSLLAFALGPLALMLAAAPVSNVIIYRTLSAMIIPLCIWLAVMLIPDRSHWGMVPQFAWGLLLAAGLLAWNPASRGGELRQVVEMIQAQWQPGDVIYHDSGHSYLPFMHYAPDLPGYFLDGSAPDPLSRRIIGSLQIQEAALENIPHQRAWILAFDDSTQSQAVKNRMAGYTQGARRVAVIDNLQLAPIYVYLQED